MGIKKHTFKSVQNSNNGKFIFSLPDEFSRVKINDTIKVSGRFNDYYPHRAAWVIPDRENSLAYSQEVFNLDGVILRGESTIIGEGDVVTIRDRWGHDNYGYFHTEITGELNEFGDELIISFSGGTSNWGEGAPIWQIHSFSETKPETGEIHHNDGVDSPSYIKTFEDFIEYDNEYMNIVAVY